MWWHNTSTFLDLWQLGWSTLVLSAQRCITSNIAASYCSLHVTKYLYRTVSLTSSTKWCENFQDKTKNSSLTQIFNCCCWLLVFSRMFILPACVDNMTHLCCFCAPRVLFCDYDYDGIFTCVHNIAHSSLSPPNLTSQHCPGPASTQLTHQSSLFYITAPIFFRRHLIPATWVLALMRCACVTMIRAAAVAAFRAVTGRRQHPSNSNFKYRVKSAARWHTPWWVSS